MAGRTRTILIAAGGTGGHLFPAAAFAREMRAREWSVVLMTDSRGRQYAKDFPADSIEDVAAATIQGRNPIKALAAGVKIFSGIQAARRRLNALAPSLIAGFGGYPSLPALWSARDLKRPILIHEQNAVLGRVNRMFAPAAAAVACGFERLDRLAPAALGRKVVVGNPVRAEIAAVGLSPYPIPAAGEKLRLLAIGGSQGARLFGEVIPAAIARLPEALRARISIVQQVRTEQVKAAQQAYAADGVAAEVSPFFTDMAQRYAAAHLIIARAGASSVTEIAVAGRPSILIPLAIAADDHQTANAEALAGIGAADVVVESAFNAPTLTALLTQRLADAHGLSVRAAAARASARPQAAQALADLAERIAAH